MKTLARAILAASLVVPMLAPAALAQRDHDPHWGGDIHRFHEHDFDVWRGGRWFHGPHTGRDGWWWIVGGQWYFYPAPVYPYPDPYIPPVAAIPVAPPSAPQMWYFCPNPQGYYPYVPQCTVPWQTVPAGSPPPR